MMPQNVSHTLADGHADPVMSATTNPFAHLFAEDDPLASCPPHLDTSRGRRWFQMVGQSLKTGQYTYQYPLEGRSGPRVSVAGQDLLMVSAYDYLGLIGHPTIEAAAVAAVREFGTGTGGVRILTGSTELHRTLERRIAAFKGTEAALTVSSGYLANIGVIPALVGRADRVLLDARAHRSLVDGCRLAGVSFDFFAHNDVTALEQKLADTPASGTTLIVVEGIYSMDGDLCPLPEVVALKQRYGCLLMVDEAHSLGVLGSTGRGISEHFGVPTEAVDFWVGSLSKAIPSNGGYIAASTADVFYLQHEAAPFVFSAALCPAATASALAALELIAAEPERIAAVTANARALREGLRERGFDTGASVSPIIPVIFGDEQRTWTAARSLLDAGIWATAIIFPAVPRGQARLRLCATASYTPADIAQILGAFEERCCSLLRC